MYIICGLYPKQKLDHSSTIHNNSIGDTLKCFEDIMEPVCPSSQFLGLLGDMTQVNVRSRLDLINSHKKMKELEMLLMVEEQNRNIPKRKSESGIDAKSILVSMSKATK